MKRTHFILSLVIVVGAIFLYTHHNTEPVTSSNSNKTPSKTTPKPTKKPTPSFDKSQYSRTDPTSIWIVVNKSYHLTPKSYVPNDLVSPDVPQRIPGATEMKMRAPAAKALEKMFAGAKTAGYDLLVSTAYRSYSYQKSLYDSYVNADGVAKADTYSARPGYSEHQTGLAIDIRDKSGVCSLEQCFENVASAKWLDANAYKYGFILRYTKDKEAVTGYEYEPWHFRYVGVDLSTEMHKQGIETLEEFFGISGGTIYRK